MALPPFLDPIVNAPRSQKLVVGVMGAIVIAAAGYFLLLAPAEAQNSQLSTQLTSLQTEVARSRAIVADLMKYRREAVELEARLNALKEKLPGEKEIPTLYRTLSDAATWSLWTVHGLALPLGFLIAILVAALLWGLYQRTRFGFELQVIGDSPRAARYAGMRTRRKIVAVMCLSGAIAGLGGASQDGDFRHLLDPRGLSQSGYGYAGIVVAALGRYNPFAVVVVAFLLGGLQNAGYTLQGADFPSGLVGVMQGLILFCALGGELFVRYRLRFERRQRQDPEPALKTAP